jgi:replicative DNA helicase
MIDNKEKIKIERDFIALLLEYKDLVSDWLESGPSIEFFDEANHTILHAISSSYDHDVLLTRNTFLSFIQQNVSSKMEKQSLERLFNAIKIISAKRDDFPNLRTKISEAFISKNAISFIDEYRQEMSSRGGIVSTKKLSERLKNLISDTFVEKKIFYESLNDYSLEFFKKIMEKREKGPDADNIKTHIKELDEAMVVGFAPGTLTLFCGDVGGHKTNMMLNVGSNVWQFSKKNVLFVPLEMPREKYYQRFISRFLKIPFDRLEHPTLLNDEEIKQLSCSSAKITEISAKNDASVYMMEAPDQIPVSVIKREIEKHIDIFKPHVVVVDYIANLIPDLNVFRKKERDDLEIGYMLKSLRVMGKPGAITNEGFAVVSGAQIGREALKRVRRSGAGKTAFYSEDIRNSHEYSADADNIFAQMEDPQQQGHRLYLYVVKARYGKKTFGNNSHKAVLEIKPEISLIQSINNSFCTTKHDEILNKVNDIASLDFKEDDNKEDKNTIFDSELNKILGV